MHRCDFRLPVRVLAAAALPLMGAVTLAGSGDRPERRLLLMPFRREARLRRSDGALGNR